MRSWSLLMLLCMPVSFPLYMHWTRFKILPIICCMRAVSVCRPFIVICYRFALFDNVISEYVCDIFSALLCSCPARHPTLWPPPDLDLDRRARICCSWLDCRDRHLHRVQVFAPRRRTVQLLLQTCRALGKEALRDWMENWGCYFHETEQSLQQHEPELCGKLCEWNAAALLWCIHARTSCWILLLLLSISGRIQR